MLLPAARRLNALSGLTPDAIAALKLAAERPRTMSAHQELIADAAPMERSYLLLEGWAARVRQLADGRRAIINFILPGDIVGFSQHERPVASSAVVALTRAVVCQAPDAAASPALERAYATSRAVDEAHLVAQITRLSRLNAYERITDLLLELLERLEIAGLAAHNAYDLPLTQEMIGDAVGLSTVHVNRTLQQARKLGDLSWSAQRVHIPDPQALRERIGRRTVRVTAPMSVEPPTVEPPFSQPLAAANASAQK
jgi:CRP-like cAMP-binding protein